MWQQKLLNNQLLAYIYIYSSSYNLTVNIKAEFKIIKSTYMASLVGCELGLIDEE